MPRARGAEAEEEEVAMPGAEDRSQANGNAQGGESVEEDGVFLRREPENAVRDADPESEDADAPFDQAVDFAPDDAPARSLAPGSGVLFPRTDDFTMRASYNPLGERLRFIGRERTVVNFGVSYYYDSNIFLRSAKREAREPVAAMPAPEAPATAVRLEDQEIESGTVLRGDLTLGFRGGLQEGPGISYSILYGARVYANESTADSSGGIDHALRGDLSIRGGYTQISFSGGMAHSSGNGLQADRQRREERLTESTTYQAGANAVRRLATGTVELGAGIQTQDFASGGEGTLAPSDRKRWSVDGAWFYDPPFLGRTTFGLGATFEREEVEIGTGQNVFTPSVRARWEATAMTRIGAWVGTQTRWFGESDAEDPGTTPAFGLDLDWQPRSETRIHAGWGGGVEQSILLENQNIAVLRASVALTQRLWGDRSLRLGYRYEHADYDPTALSASPRSRRDNYHQFEAELNQALDLGRLPKGEVAVFYNYNRNASEFEVSEFSQHIAGVRMGFSF